MPYYDILRSGKLSECLAAEIDVVVKLQGRLYDYLRKTLVHNYVVVLFGILKQKLQHDYRGLIVE